VSEAGELLASLGLAGPLHALHVGLRAETGSGAELIVRSPIDGHELARLQAASAAQLDRAIGEALDAFLRLRELPAPRRGELVRRFGQRLRAKKAPLAALISLEVGKIAQEALGEVQEMIDIADFAVGLSRQLYGLTIASERPGHRLMEQWHPLGPIGVISAFNFPVAVWAWNATLALVCGDPVLWKPSEKTPLTALACHHLLAEVLADMPDVPEAVAALAVGGAELGQRLASSERLPLISATGSTRMGRSVAQAVAARLGRSLLELGGNNGLIVAPSADLEQALRAIVFAAVGTCGQRCTSLRRLIVHRSRYDAVVERLTAIYARLPVGDPRSERTLVGPLIDASAYESMQRALEAARVEGGTVWGGERIVRGVPEGGWYVRPALVQLRPDAPIVQEETFAPLLYVMAYDTLEEAIAIHNAVPQGLSSAIFTTDVREAERFCSASGSDCGIVNVNLGTSGAEIGGAFGGEKLTGGGRESGSDAWKAYMRRVTNTVNYSSALPLAQGIQFDL
jgi:aldehyde dehydrogenase (NAD+)